MGINRKISIRRLLVDPIPNSPNLPHKNCMVERKVKLLMISGR